MVNCMILILIRGFASSVTKCSGRGGNGKIYHKSGEISDMDANPVHHAKSSVY